MTFDRPELLLLAVPLLAAFWLIALRSNAAQASDQRVQSLVMRCLAALFIVVALAGPLIHRDSRRQCVMYLVDVSRSISASERAQEFALVRRALADKPRADSAAVIAFASDPDVLVRPSKSPQPPGDTVTVDANSTDIGAAIRTAAAIAPRGSSRQIVLLTDGDETAGSASEAATASGMPVSAVNPASFLDRTGPEASVARVDAPATTHAGEPILVRTVIVSSVAQPATVTVTAGPGVRAQQRVTLAAGKTLVSVPLTLVGSGLRRIEVDLDAPQDTLLDNNRGDAMTRVVGPPAILYLTDHPDLVGPTLRKAMSAHGIRLDLVSALDAPTSAAGFAAYDSVILSDTPSSEMTMVQQSALQTAVRDFGVGLGMVGGTRAYIGGGWAGTPVEQALPVWMKPREGIKNPPADVVIVLDASGSMGMEEDGVEKVQLAARAAVTLLGSLQPDDRVAVLAVTTVPKVVLPFSRPKDALAARADIEGVEAGGGGIYCLVGLEAAYDLLDSSKASIKHVIICPDTSDSEQQEHCVALARSVLTSDHITTSVCGIGSWEDSDVPFQRALAAAGGGQLQVVERATDLPTFFANDLKHYQAPPYIEKPFHPAVASGAPMLVGFDAAAEPALLGYNMATTKPGAKIAMHAPGEPDPVLAYETYGLGRTFAFTSDEIDHWAAKWLPWNGYALFWTQLLRWSMRAEKPATFEAFTSLSPGSSEAHVVVDAFSPSGAFDNGDTFEASVASPSGSVSQVTLAQTGPGRYEATVPATETGAYLVSVAQPSNPAAGAALLGISQPYPAEYAQRPPDLPLLRQIADQTGGKMFDSATDAWSFRPGAAPVAIDMSATCILLGALLFVLDVAWRRLGLRLRPERVATPARQAAKVVAQAGATVAATSADIASGSARRRKVAEKVSRAEVDEQALLSRPVGGRAGFDEDERDPSYPLVASLDERRKRERAGENRRRDG